MLGVVVDFVFVLVFECFLWVSGVEWAWVVEIFLFLIVVVVSLVLVCTVFFSPSLSESHCLFSVLN